MRIDISRYRLLLAVGEGWGRQAGKHFIEDEHFDTASVNLWRPLCLVGRSGHPGPVYD